MTCASIAQELFLEVEIDVGGGDEVGSEFSGEGVVKSNEHLGGFRGVRSLSGESDLNHGGDERGGQAMAGHVGDEDADVLVIDSNEIVEIAGNGSHGGVTSGDIEARQLGNRVREDGELDLASHFEFFVESLELRSKLSAGFAEENVAADTGFDDGGRERLVDVIDSANFEAAGLVLGTGLAGEEDNGDFRGGGIGFEAGADFVAVHARHHYVEEDEVGLFFGVGQGQGLFTVRRDLGAIGILERARDDADVSGRVVDDEDKFWSCGCWLG